MDYKKLQYFYWTGFNFLVRRVMGFLWLLGGGIATAWSLASLFDPSSTINVQGIPSASPSVKLLGVAVSLLVTLFGWFFIRIPKYYPPAIEDWIRKNFNEQR
jgi:hypothetical protein